MRTRTTRLLATVAAAVLFATLAACGGSGSDEYSNDDSPRDDMSLQSQWSELMKRPTIDEAIARHEEMQKELTNALGSEFQLPAWQKGDNASDNPGCNDFDKVDAWDAITHFMDNWITQEPIPANQWPRAVDTVRRIGANYGFTTPGIEIDEDSYRQFDITDDYGAKLTVNSGTDPAGTLVGVDTACHLLAEAKTRGVPAEESAPPTE